MSKKWETYSEMREAQEIDVKRERAGRYTIRRHGGATWRVWRGINGRWYGESESHIDKMIDAPTLTVAKHDIRRGYYVDCAGAGGDAAYKGWCAGMGARGYAGSPAEREDRQAKRL